MKNAKFFASLFLLISIAFISCTPDQNYINTTKEIITQGKWSVDYYFAGQNKTADYTNYEFSFKGDGQVICQQASSLCTGTWGMIRDVSGKDVLTIQMNSAEPHLSQLSEQWNVTDKTLTEVAMKGNSTELHFKKL